MATKKVHAADRATGPTLCKRPRAGLAVVAPGEFLALAARLPGSVCTLCARRAVSDANKINTPGGARTPADREAPASVALSPAQAPSRPSPALVAAALNAPGARFARQAARIARELDGRAAEKARRARLRRLGVRGSLTRAELAAGIVV